MRQKLLDYAVEILKRWATSLKTLVVALFDFVGLTLIVIVLIPLVRSSPPSISSSRGNNAGKSLKGKLYC